METTGIVLWVGADGSALIICADGKKLAYSNRLDAICAAGHLPDEGDEVLMRVVDDSPLRRCEKVMLTYRGASPNVREVLTTGQVANVVNMRDTG